MIYRWFQCFMCFFSYGPSNQIIHRIEAAPPGSLVEPACFWSPSCMDPWRSWVAFFTTCRARNQWRAGTKWTEFRNHGGYKCYKLYIGCIMLYINSILSLITICLLVLSIRIQLVLSLVRSLLVPLAWSFICFPDNNRITIRSNVCCWSNIEQWYITSLLDIISIIV